MIITELSIPTEAFALDRALSQVPDLQITADRLATHDSTARLPYLWASGSDLDAFEAAIAHDESVASILATQECTEQTLYHLEWSPAVQDRITTIVEPNGAILSAEGTQEQWTLRVRYDSREQVKTVQDAFADQPQTVHVHNIFTQDTPVSEQKGLTHAQQEALATAVEQGYYQVPREATMEVVAAELGISEQSTSERLRRGITALVQNTVLETN